MLRPLFSDPSVSPPLRTFLPSNRLSVAVWRGRLDFLQDFKVIGTRARRYRSFLALVFIEIRVTVSGWFGEEAAGGTGEGPKGDAVEGCIFEGWCGEFVGLGGGVSYYSGVKNGKGEGTYIE
jgi:hypothetical protein